MEYKILAKYILEAEIKLLLGFICPDAELRYYYWRIRGNYVEVYFEELGGWRYQ